MTHIVKRIFKLNLRIMRLLGFYPPQKWKHFYQIYSIMVYICCTVPVPVLASFSLMVGEINMTKIGDNCFAIIQGGCFIFKLIPFIFNSAEIRKTIYMINLPIFNEFKSHHENMLLEECVKTCKRNSSLFLMFCAVTMAGWSPLPFFNGNPFPVEIWLPFDGTADIKIHCLIYFAIVFGITNGAMANGAIDPLLSGMVCFAVTQLKILKFNLTNLRSYAITELKEIQNDRTNIGKLLEQLIYQKISECVQHHNEILRFIENYEKIYSSVVFSQFSAAVAVIGLSCLQLSIVKPFTFTFFAMIVFVFTMTMEIFQYSYFGTTLYNESNSLTNAIYMGEWYKCDIKTRKMLLIIMERSKKPIIITAGKILDLSLETFTTILRRAYSILAVLNNFKLDL